MVKKSKWIYLSPDLNLVKFVTTRKVEILKIFEMFEEIITVWSTTASIRR